MISPPSVPRAQLRTKFLFCVIVVAAAFGFLVLRLVWLQVVQGPRYGYRYGETVPSRFDTTTLLNLFITRRLSNHLELGLNCTNLGGAADPYIQAYGQPGVGGNPPLPGPGRTYSLRLAWAF